MAVVLHVSLPLGDSEGLVRGCRVPHPQILHLQILVKVAMSLIALVTVWRSWNSAPAPAIRLWALGFAGMPANFLDQFWTAVAWEREYEKQSGRRQPPKPAKASPSQHAWIRDADAFEFPNLIARPALGILLPSIELRGTTLERSKKTDNTILVRRGEDQVVFAALFLSRIYRTSHALLVS